MELRSLPVKLKAFYLRHTFGLQKKLFIVSLLTGILMVVSLSFFAVTITEKSMKESINKNVQNQTMQIGNTLKTYIDEIQKKIMTVAVDEDLIHVMDGVNEDESYKVYRNIYNTLSKFRIIDPWSDIYIYCYANGDLLSSDSTNISGDYPSYSLDQYKWYQELMGAKADFVLLENYVPPVSPGSERFGIALRYQPYNRAGYQGIIIYGVKKTYFTRMLSNTSFTNDDILLITNKEGDIVYHSNRGAMGDKQIDHGEMRRILSGIQSTYTSSSGKKFIVNSNALPSSNWYVVSFSDEKRLELGLSHFREVVVIITALCIAILIFVSYFISSGFIRPIKHLMKLMQGAENSGYRVFSDIRRNDEIGKLSIRFNAMIKQVLENQVLRKEAEIYGLQQQINPHFLYNTLESIKSLAAIHDVKDIRAMAQQLGDLFRYSIDADRQKTVNIIEEIRHVQNYIGIQKIRFQDRFEAVYDIDPEVYEFETVKFILQPIVENAVYHGIEQIPGNGLLTVRAKLLLSQRQIVFEIIDNGGGMDEAFVHRLNEYVNGIAAELPDHRNRSIGLRNVQERIHLFFGEEYGMAIESRVGEGTRVVLRIPAWKEAMEKHD